MDTEREFLLQSLAEILCGTATREYLLGCAQEVHGQVTVPPNRFLVGHTLNFSRALMIMPVFLPEAPAQDRVLSAVASTQESKGRTGNRTILDEVCLITSKWDFDRTLASCAFAADLNEQEKVLEFLRSVYDTQAVESSGIILRIKSYMAPLRRQLQIAEALKSRFEFLEELAGKKEA